uniref:Putative helicase n=1 Tax=viral metagenome TaxID=1070528 RepID=A0A6M3L3L4_9ZZZZ
MKRKRGASIEQLIATDNEWAAGALIALYSSQTLDEQIDKGTKYQNAVGFNGYDAPLLSSIAQKYISNRELTINQLAVIKRLLPKYHNQLSSAFVFPRPVAIKSTMIRKKIDMKWAGIGSGVFAGKLEIKFAFTTDEEGRDKFFKCLALVRGLPEGRAYYYSSERIWRTSLSVKTVEELKAADFQLEDRLYEWHQKMTAIKMVRRSLDIKGLKLPLYPFQKEAVGFIISRGGKALVGDDPGLGKTATALAWLHHTEAYPAIAVVPSTVKYNWQNEVRKWLPDTITTKILFGKKSVELGHTLPDITIINYDILKGWLPTLIEAKVTSLLLDEIHYIKNRKTQRTKATLELSKAVKNVVCLSGTPIINRPEEFFNTLNILDPENFPNLWSYAHKFCAPKHTRFGWSFTGSARTKELYSLVTRTVMLRRKKEDVLKDLPPKIRVVLPVEIDNRAEYIKAEEDFIEWVRVNFGEVKADRAANAEALARIEYLKQLTIAGKMDAVIKWVDDFLGTRQKLVIFGTHHWTIDTLMGRFRGSAVKIDGRDSSAAREMAVRSFQENPDIRLLVGNVKAAGVGITLTAASNTCFCELGWNPGELEQAEDRVHRIGQDADSVTAHYLLAKDTIEEEIAALIDEKRKVLSEVLDGKETEKSNILTELLAKIMKGRKANGKVL